MAKKAILLFAMTVLLLGQADSQKRQGYYLVELKDKAASPYSIHRPYEFLSPKSIARKKFYGIPITAEDLPVSPTYMQQLKDKGASLHVTSKWLNSAVVRADSAALPSIGSLPFVRSIKRIGWYRPAKVHPANVRPKEKKYEQTGSRYGKADDQIRMLNGIMLHRLGYEGSGRLVAVLDGGFQNVDVMPFFDSLRVDGRLLQGRDFVEEDQNPYESLNHGTQVLSTMAANLPGLMVGTAPAATYICVKTEDGNGESPVEEENWIAGAEFADSLGVDVINSSLGYTTFDEAQMNHTHEMLDGRTARASIAAGIAARKGILVVNSAGNSGNDDWQKIGVPSDAEGVLAVAATTPYRGRAGFSSLGPAADGRVKPNVAAQGVAATVADLNSYNTGLSNGTSFASPILAGMAASLWSAFPEKSSAEIIQAIERSGHQAQRPDAELGFGIPDFFRAYETLLGYGTPDYQESDNARWYVLDGGKGGNELVFFSLKGGDFLLDIRDVAGAPLLRTTGTVERGTSVFKIDANQLPRGFHLITLIVGGHLYHLKATDLR
jgi:serine protease AprX